MDYEFTQGSVLFKPTWVMMPDVVDRVAFRDKKGSILHYPGIKEDVYVPSLRPDSSIRSRLGLADAHIVVALRPPASEAHYHNARSDELFSATMQFLIQNSEVKVILLPRNGRQAAELRSSYASAFESGRLVIPERAEDGLNIIWHSDVVISGGGTMNREAAALGVPVYSIFRGQIGAVDKYLAREQRLTLLENPNDVRTKIALKRRSRSTFQNVKSTTLADIIHKILGLMDSAAQPLTSNAERQTV
jgi:predicted glycosyltransferase